MLKIIVAGSRDFSNYPLLKETLDKAREEWGQEITIVSGCARGADALGERYAKENCLPLDMYPAQWDLYGKSAGYRRNVQMAENADALVAFRVGNSKGTTHMINIAREKGLRMRVVEVPKNIEKHKPQKFAHGLSQESYDQFTEDRREAPSSPFRAGRDRRVN